MQYTLQYTTLITPHHNYNYNYNCNCSYTTLIAHYNYNSTTPHYNYNYNCTTPHYIQQLWWGDHCNHCNHSRKHSSNHLSVHQWIRSAIRDSQQPTSPTGFLFFKIPPPPCAVLLVLYRNYITFPLATATPHHITLHSLHYATPRALTTLHYMTLFSKEV